MIEHFARFASEALALALPALAPYQRDGGWRQDCVCPFRIITGATPAGTDPDGNAFTTNVYAPGFYLRISLLIQDDALAALPQSFVTDSVERGIDKATTILSRKGYTPAQIAAFRIEPELLGVKSPNE